MNMGDMNMIMRDMNTSLSTSKGLVIVSHTKLTCMNGLVVTSKLNLTLLQEVRRVKLEEEKQILGEFISKLAAGVIALNDRR